MPAIREIIARRTDLSTFVVHLTRQYEGASAAANLEAILVADRIEARNPFGAALSTLRRRGSPADDFESQKCVCFTETPLEHTHLLLQEITDLRRDCEFAPYGIAITKRVARESGVNPVWYTDITPAGRTWLVTHVNALVDEALDRVAAARAEGNAAAIFEDHPIARLTPFIEQMGSGDGYRKEFWWEREWRCRRALQLPIRYLVIAPEGEHERFDAIANGRAPRAALIGAAWGLEEIIGRLAGHTPEQVGPPI